MASELCQIMDELVSSISVAEPNSCSSNKLHLVKVNIKDCQSLLKFLCWMPKGHMKSKTLSDYTNCIISLERYSLYLYLSETIITCYDVYFNCT